MLDNICTTMANEGQGYYGVTENVPTYIRNSFKTPMGAGSNSVIISPNKSGAFENPISYKFGYTIGTTNQDGETYLDGINGQGIGMNILDKSWNYVTMFSCFRYYTGILNKYNNRTQSYNRIGVVANCNNNTQYSLDIENTDIGWVDQVTNLNNNNYGFYISSHKMKVNIINSNNNVTSIYCAGCYNELTIGTMANNKDKVVVFVNCFKNKTTIGEMLLCAINAFDFSSANDNLFRVGNATGKVGNESFINLYGGSNTFEFTKFSTYGIASIASNFATGEIWFLDYQQIQGNFFGVHVGGDILWQTTEKIIGGIGSWKIVTNFRTNKFNPFKLKTMLMVVFCLFVAQML